mgnify:CR=1 FL=1
MKKLTFLSILVVAYCLSTNIVQAQVAINTDGSDPNAAAMLDVKSTSKGLLIPRMSTAQRTTLGTIAVAGLMVFDTDFNQFFYHNGTIWLEGSTGNLWTRSGSITYNTNLTDNVGIGTSTPGYIAGATRYLTVSSSGGGSNKITSLELKGASGTTFSPVNRIDFLSQGTVEIYNLARIETRITNAQFEGELLFYTNGGSLTERMRIDEDGKVGIGTSSPARTLEVNSGSEYRTARLSSTQAGATLEFVGTNATNWAVGTFDGQARLFSSTDIFSSYTDEFVFSKTVFTPFTDNSKDLGTSSLHWKRLYGIDGSFTGQVAVGTESFLGPLHVHDGTSSHATLYITPSASASGDSSSIFLAEDSDASFGMYWLFDGSDPQGGEMELWGKSLNTHYGPHLLIDRNTGNMSISSSAFMGKLHIHDGESSNTKVYITPQTTVNGDSTTIFMAEDDEALYGMYWLYDGNGNDMELWGKSLSNTYGPHFIVDRNSGNAAFGSTFATGYKLSVGGKIICEEVRVALTAAWPDYVFKKDYSLMPVEQLADFVDTHGHLPNIPSAVEMEKSGQEVGEMQRLMMEKIEELSLYIIDQDKRLTDQQKQIRELRDQLDQGKK